MQNQAIRRNSLEEEAKFALEEARVIVPGVQALLGFQLIAVFNGGFQQQLGGGEQVAHRLATFLTALAMVLLLMPAAFHRIAEPGGVSGRFVHLAGRSLLWALTALSLSVSIEIYLVAKVITHSDFAAAGAGALLYAACLVAWTLCPLYYRRFSTKLID